MTSPSHHQWKTNDQSPARFSETRTVQARTQITQSIRRSGDKQSAPDTGILYCPKPAAAKMPRRSGFPRGQERCWRGIGDRNPLSLFNRPREEPIKSTGAMRYSSLKKAKTNDHSPTQLPYRQGKSKNPEKTCKKGLTSGEECGILSELQESGTARSAKAERAKKTWKKFEKPLDKRTTKWYNK